MGASVRIEGYAVDMLRLYNDCYEPAQRCGSGLQKWHISQASVAEGSCHVMDAGSAEILEQSISKAPLAIAAAKAAVDDGFEVPLLKGLAFERAHYTQLFGTEDRLEALRAFAEKRRPSFKGC